MCVQSFLFGLQGEHYQTRSLADLQQRSYLRQNFQKLDFDTKKATSSIVTKHIALTR